MGAQGTPHAAPDLGPRPRRRCRADSRALHRPPARRLGAAGSPDARGLRLRLPADPRQGARPSARLDFIRAHEDILLTGTSGTGKSHIAKAIAVRACAAGVRVLYRQFHVLLDDLYAGLADNTYDQRLGRYIRVPLLVIDDVGLGRVRRSPDEPTAAHMLFALMDHRVGRVSTVLTSNIRLSAWGPYLGDPSLVMAILDRTIHHATRIEVDGPSWRDKESQELNQKRRAAAKGRRASGRD